VWQGASAGCAARNTGVNEFEEVGIIIR
jgi:hypothetical protein